MSITIYITNLLYDNYLDIVAAHKEGEEAVTNLRSIIVSNICSKYKVTDRKSIVEIAKVVKRYCSRVKE